MKKTKKIWIVIRTEMCMKKTKTIWIVVRTEMYMKKTKKIWIVIRTEFFITKTYTNMKSHSYIVVHDKTYDNMDITHNRVKSTHNI